LPDTGSAFIGRMAMIVDVSTVLDCSAEKAWNEVQKSSVLLHVNWPLARLVSLDGPFPERWSAGLTLGCKPFAFGLIPIGVHTLHIDRIDHETRQIQTREHDRLISRWDHLISIKPLHDSRSIYRDRIDIDAGSLTFLVWAWANWLYRHRQRRWRALAKTL
jgi:hypothetical protein